MIPQIILSGVIVKYEKLNPNISTPNSIPWYGEIMTARWGYEALAVYQFKENKYEQDLYPLNKVMSIAEFKKNYWVPNLRNKIEFVERNLGKKEEKKRNLEKMAVIRNEISRETETNKFVKFEYKDSLYLEKLSPQIISALKKYISNINKLYISIYNQANDRQDNLLSSKQRTRNEREKFLKLKRNYYNEKLADFVENKNELVRIIDYKGRLYQKIDPIYLDPDPVFLKAHFYAPRKFVFGKYHDTFIVNIIVILSITIFTYIILYFRLLKKFLDMLDKIIARLRKE